MTYEAGKSYNTERGGIVGPTEKVVVSGLLFVHCLGIRGDNKFGGYEAVWDNTGKPMTYSGHKYGRLTTEADITTRSTTGGT